MAHDGSVNTTLTQVTSSGPSQRGTVLSFPARSNRDVNPYNYILTEALEARGWNVREPTGLNGLRERAQIVHFHWPQAPMSKDWGTLTQRTAKILGTIAAQKARGASIVWTVHNPVSHEMARPRLEEAYMRLFVKLLDGAIFLGESTRTLAEERYPHLAEIPHAIIPHHLYGSEYPPPRSNQDDANDGSERPTCVGLVGELKEYKGIEELVTKFGTSAETDIELRIWGRFSDPEFGRKIRSLIDQYNRQGSRIQLFEGRLDNKGFVDAIASCDALILPYSSDANSGVAILAAELGVPLIVAASRALRELVSEIGHPGSAVMYSGLEVTDVREFAQKARETGKVRARQEFRETRAAAAVARLTSDFFERLMQVRQSHTVAAATSTPRSPGE